MSLTTLDYYIHNRTLTIRTETKYLKVAISSDLSWSRHADNVMKKANFTMGFLKRNIRSAPQAAKETAYKSFVRPIVEYANTNWAPFTVRLRWCSEGQQDLCQMTTAAPAMSQR